MPRSGDDRVLKLKKKPITGNAKNHAQQGHIYKQRKKHVFFFETARFRFCKLYNFFERFCYFINFYRRVFFFFTHGGRPPRGKASCPTGQTPTPWSGHLPHGEANKENSTPLPSEQKITLSPSSGVQNFNLLSKKKSFVRSTSSIGNETVRGGPLASNRYKFSEPPRSEGLP